MLSAEIDNKFASFSMKMIGDDKLTTMKDMVDFASDEEVLKETNGVSIQRAFDIIINQADLAQNIDYKYDIIHQRYEYITHDQKRLAIPENQLDLEKLYAGAAGLMAHPNNVSYISKLSAEGWTGSFVKLIESLHHIDILAPSGKKDPRIEIVKDFDENEGVLASNMKECISETVEIYHLKRYYDRQNSYLKEALMNVSGLLGQVAQSNDIPDDENDYVDWEPVVKLLGPI